MFTSPLIWYPWSKLGQQMTKGRQAPPYQQQPYQRGQAILPTWIMLPGFWFLLQPMPKIWITQGRTEKTAICDQFWPYMCASIYIYICYMLCLCACMHIYIYMRVRMCVCIYSMRFHAYSYASIYLFVHLWSFMDIYIYITMHNYRHTHRHLHLYNHICIICIWCSNYPSLNLLPA
jgi:hypothetical protein